MAWTSVGSLGAGTAPKVGSDEYQFSFSSDVDAGAVVVVWIAWDNIFSVFSPTSAVLFLDDSVGNMWARLGGQTGSNCFAGCSSMVHIFACQLKYPIPMGAYVRAYAGYGGLLECKVASAWEFALPEGYGWAVTDSEFSGVEERPGNGVPMSWGGGESAEYLFLHGISIEGPFTDTFTDDGGWTAIDADGTTGGADDENISLHGAWKIATASSASIDVAVTETRDICQIIGGIQPVFKSTTFPRTPLIDDFNRADEEPLDAGIWVPYFDEGPPTESVTTGPSSPGTRLLQLVSNEAVAGPTNAGGQATVEIYECDDVEVWVTYSHIEVPGSYGICILAHHTGTSDDANAFGYNVTLGNVGMVFLPGGWFVLRSGEQGNQGVIHRPTLWFEMNESVGPQDDDSWRVGLQRIRNTNHLWLDRGDGWEWVGARRTTRGDRPTSGRLGLAIWDPLSRCDDFGGGATCYLVGMNWRYADRRGQNLRGLKNPSDVYVP